MVGVNELIFKEIDKLSFKDETKQILKDLLMVELRNQQRNSKLFFEQYDSIISKDLV